MVLDYSERHNAPKNRPRRQPVGLYLVFLAGVVGAAYGLGFGTAWYLYRPAAQARKAPQPAAAVSATAAKPARPAAAAAPVVQPAAPAAKGAEVPLTFYETLPKGGKSIIGTGLNPKKDERPGVARPASAPPAAKGDKAAKAAKPAEQVKAGKENASPRFSVQVASYKEKKEADLIREKLAAKGLPALTVETRIEGKGTWYRVKVGQRLSRQEAEALAARLGKGALVIPE